MGVAFHVPVAGMLPSRITYGFSVHDGYYSIDFARMKKPVDPNFNLAELSNHITDRILVEITNYAKRHMFKFIAVAFSERVKNFCPRLCSRLWLELDILPFVFKESILHDEDEDQCDNLDESSCDEVADSLARKIVMFFGPRGLPRLSIGYRNKVGVDSDGLIHMLELSDFQKSCSPTTWNCLMPLVRGLRSRQVNGHKGVRIAFFNATPQGGGVALMRHAMIRLFKLLDLQVTWYVPKPNPVVFRITKNNHNIIQGVADNSLRISVHQKQQFSLWIENNYQKYWETGPLNANKPPGVDIAVVDDPQMVGIIPKARQAGVRVIYRSHIEIRSDLIKLKSSPQQEVWDYLWQSGIKDAEVFISHPVRGFIPETVDINKVGLMGASTDWLDGLNKNLGQWDTVYYISEFKKACDEIKAGKLVFPMRPYVCQIARFDPSKGIPDVLESYRKLRMLMDEDLPLRKIPQLVIAGHGAVDDPDGTMVYDQTMQTISLPEYDTISSDIIVIRLGPSDQLLNCILSNASVVLQLSYREGFEVKVSEAIHKGKPVVAYRAGGIPLQVQHGKNGFLVEVGDTDMVALILNKLLFDKNLLDGMAKYARSSVSDEVGTVGNCLAWLFMFNELAAGHDLNPNGQWIYDLMRQHVGQPWQPGENRLPRTLN
ncbi:hypothetical protein V1514DRAFT_276428 [Lipomyces japonicus]|uniref:uncharacterized protein n=1 Tax=Lipomyces japonicus TaxID=56871 RepID=UPI0034CEC523